MAIFIVAVVCLIIGLFAYVLVDASLFGGDKVSEEAERRHKLMIEREKQMYKNEYEYRKRQDFLLQELQVKERRFQESGYKYEG